MRDLPRAWSPPPVLTLLAAAAVAIVAMTVFTPPASAHTELVAANPRAGAVLTLTPARIVLTFDDPMAEQFSTVVVTVGGGPARRLETTTKGRVITAAVPSSLRGSSTARPGETTPWRVVYRVVSADGHPVNGTIAFRVKLSSPQATPRNETASPEPQPSDSVDTRSSSPSESDQGSSAVLSVVLIGGLAAVVAAVISGLLLRLRRRENE